MRSRKASFAVAALAAFAWTVVVAGPGTATSKGSADPAPIPGGIDVPPLIHVFAPGPTSAGLMGVDVEPSTITNFNGLSAYAVFTGHAVDAHGAPYDAVLDMRIFQGEYVSSDGTHHHGTFGFI